MPTNQGHGDEDCGPGLGCDATIPRGVCTAACVSSPDSSVEEASCGGDDSTCLAVRPDGAYCTQACTPGIRDGDCGPGRLCSTFWTFAPQPDDPGCWPFCTDDSDCAPGRHCDRLGGCAGPVDLEALADGEPCHFTDGRLDAPCRGACFKLDPSAPDDDLCASLINLANGADCPDSVDMRPLTGGDDLGVCMYEPCREDADCTAPLHCVPGPVGTICGY